MFLVEWFLKFVLNIEFSKGFKKVSRQVFAIILLIKGSDVFGRMVFEICLEYRIFKRF